MSRSESLHPVHFLDYLTLSFQDVKLAMKAGVEGVVVSNHGELLARSNLPNSDMHDVGGRQVDGAIGSLDALALIMKEPEIVDAQRSGKLTVFFDSGIRTGSDIARALLSHHTLIVVNSQ
jgi:lactate 2-monooxygenase